MKIKEYKCSKILMITFVLMMCIMCCFAFFKPVVYAANPNVNVDVDGMADDLARAIKDNVSVSEASTVSEETTALSEEELTSTIATNETTNVVNENEYKEKIKKESKNDTISIVNMEQYKDAGTIVLNFKNVKTKEKYKISFFYKNKYVAEIINIPDGEYKVSVASYGNLEKFTINEKKITIKETSTKSNVNITPKKVIPDEGVIKNFLRKDGVILGLLVISAIAYTIIKKKSEK